MPHALALSLLLACGGEDARIGGACEDLACRAEAVVEAWPDDPTGVRAVIDAEADAGARARLAEAVFEAWPGASVCDLLEPGIVQRRCDRVAARAETWSWDRLDEEALAEAVGPGHRSLAGSPAGRLSGRADAAAPRACGDEVPDHSCRVERAREAAEAGDLAAAAVACQDVGAVRWQPVCLLQSVELACRPDRREACGLAAELCLQAGPWRVPCLEHVTVTLAGQADPAAALAPDGWPRLGRYADELSLRLGALDPILADRVVERLWADAARRSYGEARAVVGRPLRHAPDRAAPHLRAAVAWRLSHLPGGAAPSSLDEAVSAAQAALALDAGQPKTRLLSAEHPGPVDLWAENLPGEEAIPWLPYLGPARRAVAADPSVDLRIVSLEAAARTSPPRDWLLVEGLSDPREVVRWTAARLLAQVQPDHPALATARADTSALVRARAGG